MRRAFAIVLLSGLALALIPACGPTPPGTRSIEEKYLDMGHANRMYHYGQSLAAQGRLEEAEAAFQQAEDTAFTSDVREAARARRFYLEKVIAAYQKGEPPPPPPVELSQVVVKSLPPEETLGPQGPATSIFDPPAQATGNLYPPVIFPGKPGGPPPAKPVNP